LATSRRNSDRHTDDVARAPAESPWARTPLFLAQYGKTTGQRRVLLEVSREILAEMVGTSRPRVNFFMNTFRKLGFVEYDASGVKVNNSLGPSSWPTDRVTRSSSTHPFRTGSGRGDGLLRMAPGAFVAGTGSNSWWEDTCFCAVDRVPRVSAPRTLTPASFAACVAFRCGAVTAGRREVLRGAFENRA
jgi:hypothetical protein